MIVGVAVCPGAPFLVEGTAVKLAGELSPLVRACREAVARLPEYDLALLVTAEPPAPGTRASASPHPPSPPWRLFGPGSVIRTTSFRRSDLPDGGGIVLSGTCDSMAGLALEALAGLPSASAPPDTGSNVAPSVGTMVGAYLLSTARLAGGSTADLRAGNSTASMSTGRSPSDQSGSAPQAAKQPATVAIEVADPIATSAMLQRSISGSERVVLLVIADGAACHGDDAPGRRDDRSGPFDAGVATALRTGDPLALLESCEPELAAQLLATVAPFELLALLTRGRPPTTADLSYEGAPRGVGYFVASWTWTPDESETR